MNKSVENVMFPSEYNKLGTAEMYRDIGKYITNHADTMAADTTDNEIVEGYDLTIHISHNDAITMSKTTKYYVEREEQ